MSWQPVLVPRGEGGSGEHEPLLMTIQFGNGRVFHTTLGHDAEAIKGMAFQVTLQRGTEWAATGDVTLPSVGSDQLSDAEPSLRDPASIGPESASPIPDIDGDGWVSLFNGTEPGWLEPEEWDRDLSCRRWGCHWKDC